MDKFLDTLLDASLDTLKIIPILLVVYLLIEFLEYKKAIQLKNAKILQGKASPIFGATIGCVPQCGFSVVSTDLYSKGGISIGALMAVFISTSDEALPIMITHPKSIPALLGLILVKVVLGIGVGYLTMFLYSKIFGKKEINEEVEIHHDGCCHHDIESEKFDWLHPILHCLKITLFIFAINLIMGLIILGVGEDNLTSFLNSSSYLQPLFACLIGIIPNCASSVVITELYLLGGLSFGSIVAGLSVNAGLGILVLFKENKKIKENLFILGMLIIPSLIVGYILHFIF